MVNDLVSITSDQAEWICNEIEKLSKEYPGLRAKLKELCRMSDDNMEWIDKPILNS
ncbi:MAG: hypothetical protein QXX99_03100 [Candidatus Bathyarchaeia archaeon]